MHSFIKKVGETIKREAQLVAGERCVVAVSGGPDSMALLYTLAQLAPLLEVSLVVGHLDHGLRPKEAAAEASLVQEAAQGLGLVCECGKVEVAAYAKEQGLSREHGARNLRYGFLEELAARHRADKIAVAHTADDQAEEVLLRLVRGTGRAGLAGMARVRDGLVIRPFLGIAKAEILRYLAAENIPYCLDSSNRERIYLRNRIRLDLLPYLQAHFNPNIGNSLRETATILQGEEELLAGMASQAYAQAVVEEQGEPANLMIQLENFLAHPLAIRRRILETACWRMGCRPTFRQIAQLLSLAETGGEGAGLHLARGLRVVRAEGRMLFCYPQGRKPVRGNLMAVGKEEVSFCRALPGPGEYSLEGLGVRIKVRQLATLPEGWEGEGAKVLYCDGEKVSFPLLVRFVRQGDRFHPLGASGRKKVGDFFTDQKIPAGQRQRIPILADQEGIIAILGVRPDQRAAIGSQTRRILAVSLHPLSPGENGFTEKAIHGK
ncbi:tRNA lysidine(34) synthetase TilS [Thiovibrio frasassiensis]|uniref:tRNA(Ile)-lysidine synthase n=1 Tax=Thiovibrio frasassiensis TaxID=2984131 RepID=A0A9X4RM64_9BACT|nr:tRNA lysidine(34) synthetase TilS [Thiovibrio frasassiensis]MDG4476015.1 tRNA lysidine(34) synthetase TilS [Thiovibrio frasassiensis]